MSRSPSLDPLARREFLQGLMEATVEHELSVLISSHLVADLERVCDYLIVLHRLAGPALPATSTTLLASHYRCSPPDAILAALPPRLAGHLRQPHRPAEHAADPQPTAGQRRQLAVDQISMEDLVLAYMSKAASRASPRIAPWRHNDDVADLAAVQDCRRIATARWPCLVAIVLAGDAASARRYVPRQRLRRTATRTAIASQLASDFLSAEAARHRRGACSCWQSG